MTKTLEQTRTAPAKPAAEKAAPRAEAKPVKGNALLKLPFSDIHALSPIVRSQVIEVGVPAKLLTRLAVEMSISMVKLYNTLGVSRATADRALKAKRNLSPADSEHAIGLARLVGQVEQIVQESGNPEGFEAGRWVAEFLETENAALGGRRPEELMRTSDGRTVVSTLIAQMQSSAYA